MSHSFFDSRTGTSEGGLHITCDLSPEQKEAASDRMIDPELAMIPHEGAPKYGYPPQCDGNDQFRKTWEAAVISGFLPLAPLYLLPEGSVLRAEWFRRAEILKKEREEKNEARKTQKEE